MGTIVAMMDHPDEIFALMKLKIAASKLSKQIPSEPHWGFSYSMLQKVSRSFALVIQQLGPELRNAVFIYCFYNFYFTIIIIIKKRDDMDLSWKNFECSLHWIWDIWWKEIYSIVFFCGIIVFDHILAIYFRFAYSIWSSGRLIQ